MFKCEICGKATQPREKQYKKMVKTRNKTYSNLDKYERVKTTKGSEIVKEINVCEKCMKGDF